MKSHTAPTPDLSRYGICSPGTVYWNLSPKELVQAAVSAGECELLSSGAVACTTGEHTGRSPKDKFIVKDATTEAKVDWGPVNAPISPEHFAALRQGQLNYLKDRDLYVREAAAGADEDFRLPIRVINETAWANLFAHHMFLRLSKEQAANHLPQFTIIHTPGFTAEPDTHGTRSEAFVVVNFTEGLVLIGGTKYAGEMKKSIFSVLNFLYPARNVFPMHCSANVREGKEPNPALFFGLSGTGKTTLSADSERMLVGDDEHGWSSKGIFNFEGGCYAKTIGLTREKEPQIWDAVRDGAVLENVVIDPETNTPDYGDGSLTENTRVAYPITHIDNALLHGTAGHPTSIVFLSCDAFGVMPPISKLTAEQAMYHFLSGYTAKVAGTEKGLDNSPTATFSACFGAPFLPLAPTKYAEMLGQRMNEHDVSCWMVNTGWVAGAYGVGNRIKLSYTRTMVTAAVNGQLGNCEFKTEPAFGLSIPTEIPGVPSEALNPRSLWSDKAAYDEQAKKLARLFVANFKQFSEASPELVAAGPQA